MSTLNKIRELCDNIHDLQVHHSSMTFYIFAMMQDLNSVVDDYMGSTSYSFKDMFDYYLDEPNGRYINYIIFEIIKFDLIKQHENVLEASFHLKMFDDSIEYIEVYDNFIMLHEYITSKSWTIKPTIHISDTNSNIWFDAITNIAVHRNPNILTPTTGSLIDILHSIHEVYHV